MQPHKIVAEKIVIELASGELAQQIAAALFELIAPPAQAVTSFEARGAWRVEAYYQDRPDAAKLADKLAEMIGMAPPPLARELVPDEDWLAQSQAALPPVKVGRFTVHGSHDRDRVPKGPHAIEIDAGEAFGTAHHATTQGCLCEIERFSRRGAFRRILDLGCGTGVLAIAAQRVLPRAHVSASDIDREAVRVARANVRRNGAGRIRVSLADGIPHPLAGYDLIVANVLAGPLIRMAQRLARALPARGVLILSGLMASQVREVRATFLPHGFVAIREARVAGWATLTLVRR